MTLQAKCLFQWQFESYFCALKDPERAIRLDRSAAGRGSCAKKLLLIVQKICIRSLWCAIGHGLIWHLLLSGIRLSTVT